MGEAMDNIVRRMEKLSWIYGDKDPDALHELEERIAAAGQNLALITYSDLVRGVVFHVPNIGNGQAYEITVSNWSGLDRALIGDFLGYISTRSYLRARFMASALVVNRA